MRKRRNADDLGGRRIVAAAMLRAMLREKRVHHVLTEVGRTQHAPVGERSFDEERQLDQMVERGAEFLQISLDVGNGAGASSAPYNLRERRGYVPVGDRNDALAEDAGSLVR